MNESANMFADDMVKGRLYSLDFFRVLFIFYILLSHVLSTLGIRNSLWLGVEFFFVLSGFFLASSVSSHQSTLAFVWNRWLRFAPCVFLGNCLVSLVLPFDPVAFAGDLLLVNEWGFLREDAWNAPVWYLSALILVSAFQMLVIRRLPTRRLQVAALSLIVLATFPVLQVYGIGPCGGTKAGIPLRMLRGLCEMSIGMLVAYGLKSHSAVRMISGVGRSAQVGLFLLVVLMPCFRHAYPRFWLFYVIVSAVLIAVVAVQAETDKVFAYVGRKWTKYVLPIFCTHYFLIYWLDALVRRDPVGCEEHRAALLVAVVCAGIGVGVLAYHCVDKPCSRLLRRFSLSCEGGKSQ